MNFSPGSLRRKPPPPPSPRQHSADSLPSTSAIEDPTNVDIYATMIHKNDVKDEDEEDELLPPLLKRLPKDFGLAGEEEDEEFELNSSISGTMIVKEGGKLEGVNKMRSYWDRSRYRDEYDDDVAGEKRFRRRNYGDEEEDGEEEGGGGDFSTFVVKKGGIVEEGGDFGTFCRKRGDG
ncbi:hypothetical protein Leryth_011706 [Lithospermum erythrorhizon]|nr:hypothetical protein Leryth_011706 [Lithospermum erythrorhizon]